MGMAIPVYWFFVCYLSSLCLKSLLFVACYRNYVFSKIAEQTWTFSCFDQFAHHWLWLHGFQVFGLFRWLEKVRNMKLRKLSCKVKPNRADDLFHCMLYEFLTGWWQVNPDELAALRKSSHCATCKPELTQWARTDFASIQSHPLVKLPLLLICRTLQLKIIC